MGRSTLKRIEVTSEHIAMGKTLSCDHCAVALAIRQQTGEEGWLIDGDALRNTKKDIFCVTPEWFDEAVSQMDGLIVEFNSKMPATLDKPFGFLLNTKTGEVTQQEDSRVIYRNLFDEEKYFAETNAKA